VSEACDGPDVAMLKANRATVEKLYRGRRRMALVGGGITLLAVLGMAWVLQSPFNTKNGRFAMAMVGVVGISLGGVSAMLAYGAWGIRRVYDAALSPPSTAALEAERRRAGWAAAVCAGLSGLALALMFVADEHRWLGPIVSILFLGGCGGLIHFLQVFHVVGSIAGNTPQKNQ
jgi:hypothetical protein